MWGLGGIEQTLCHTGRAIEVVVNTKCLAYPCTSIQWPAASHSYFLTVIKIMRGTFPKEYQEIKFYRLEHRGIDLLKHTF